MVCQSTACTSKIIGIKHIAVVNLGMYMDSCSVISIPQRPIFLWTGSWFVLKRYMTAEITLCKIRSAPIARLRREIWMDGVKEKFSHAGTIGYFADAADLWNCPLRHSCTDFDWISYSTLFLELGECLLSNFWLPSGQHPAGCV